MIAQSSAVCTHTYEYPASEKAALFAVFQKVHVSETHKTFNLTISSVTFVQSTTLRQIIFVSHISLFSISVVHVCVCETFLSGTLCSTLKWFATWHLAS